MLRCEDHRERGEREAAARLSIVGNRPYCEECWAGAPWHVKSKGSVPVVGSAKEEGSVGRHSSIDEAKVRELHGQGLTDGQIAQKLHCSAGGVLAIRRRVGLASSGQGRKPKADLVRAAVASQGGEFHKVGKANGHAEVKLPNNPIEHALEELRHRRDDLNSAIEVLEGIVTGAH